MGKYNLTKSDLVLINYKSSKVATDIPRDCAFDSTAQVITINRKGLHGSDPIHRYRIYRLNFGCNPDTTLEAIATVIIPSSRVLNAKTGLQEECL